MSLLSSIQLANNALRANMIGLQVVGQNIANVNTPGYLREEVIFTPAPTQRVGGLLMGLGVEVSAIVQKVDKFLQSRLRNAVSDRAASESQEQAYLELEQLLGELSDTDLSTGLNNFFGSINEVLNQPESVSVRNLAILQGKTLAGDISQLASRASEIRVNLNNRVSGVATNINLLTDEIRRLNVQIVETEGGGSSKSDAVGLRDKRGLAASSLAELVDVRIDEQASGSLNISLNGTFLVFEGLRTEVQVVFTPDRGLNVATLQFVGTELTLTPMGGELAGLTLSRDQILGDFIDQLDQFAQTLIFEFNKVHSSGQGLTGFQNVTGEFLSDDVSLPLNATGLPFTPVNGSFQVQIFNKQTGLTQTTDVFVDLDGLDGDDATLTSLAAALNAINGLSATITPTRGLTISSDSADQDFAFANDTSGILAALGINTFFSGRTAQGIGVNQVLLDDPAKFAASQSGIGVDSNNAVELTAFLDRSLVTVAGSSISILYDRIVGSVTQGASVTRSVAEGFRVFEENLNGQNLAISGVSLDEEAIKLIQFQRAFQAAARYIVTLNELLEELVKL